MKEIADLKIRKPGLDATKLTDASRIRAYSEEVDLFGGSWLPEILQASEFKWHKADSNSYVLLLLNRESVVITQDILEKWHIIGTCNGHNIKAKGDTLEECIQWADKRVRVLGGRQLTSNVKREASWHFLPPSEGQIKFCRKQGIIIPPGATRGDVAAKLNERMVGWQRPV